MRSLAGYLGIGLIKLIGLLPLRGAQNLGRLFGVLFGLYRSRFREVGRVNLTLCYPDKTEAERNALLAETLKQSSMTVAEMGAMWGSGAEELLSLVQTVHGEELFTQALENPRGLLILIPHIGNWELTNTYLSARSKPTIMYRPSKSPSFDAWMLKKRQAFGGKLVPTTRAGVEALFSTLEKNGTVWLLADQTPARPSGVFVPFMGVEALTVKLPAKLLQKTGALALFCFVERLPDAQGFDIHFIAADDGIYSDDLRTSTAAMNKGYERCIERCPAQYQWGYKRFKHVPEGQPNPYVEAKVP